MAKIVSNTTPIIALLKIGQLELLQKLYGHIVIPEAVFDEIEAGKNKTYYKDLSQIPWFSISSIKSKEALKYFLDLDAGEAEAIALAVETGAEAILLDEKLGRHHAKHAGLAVIGTIGVLLKAKKNGLIKNIKPILEDLQTKGIWLSQSLVKQALASAKEEQRA